MLFVENSFKIQIQYFAQQFTTFMKFIVLFKPFYASVIFTEII